jgi:uncharacterized membrane protein YvlD (DUF360 family)
MIKLIKLPKLLALSLVLFLLLVSLTVLWMVRRLLQSKSQTPKNGIPKSCIVLGTVSVIVKQIFTAKSTKETSLGDFWYV